MDVLQLKKDDHSHIRALFAEALASQSQQDRVVLVREATRQLGVHFLLEANYLYPEVRGLFPKSEEMVEKFLHNHRVIYELTQKAGSALKKGSGDELESTTLLVNLAKAVDEHFADEEKNVMPKIRQRMPTAAREELYEVFLDVKQDALQEGKGEEAFTDGLVPLVQNL